MSNDVNPVEEPALITDPEAKLVAEPELIWQDSKFDKEKMYSEPELVEPQEDSEVGTVEVGSEDVEVDLSRAQGPGVGPHGMTLPDTEVKEIPMAMDPDKIRAFQESEDSEDDEPINADPLEINFMLECYMARVESLTHRYMHVMARCNFYEAIIKQKGTKPDPEDEEEQTEAHKPKVYLRAIEKTQHRNVALTARVKFYEQYMGAQAQIIEKMSEALRTAGVDPEPILAPYFAPQTGEKIEDPATTG